jgi:RNA polymerase sigma-70 factor (ECF subfamily)
MAGDNDELERLRRGEMAALADAYDAHHEVVRRFARRLLADEAEAEDLVQETFLALPRAARAFRGEATLRTFLLGIATNHARHHVRAAARRRAAYTRSREHAEPSPPSTPEDGTNRRELAEALTLALDELPFDQRVAVTLCEIEERSSAEVATIVGVPEATVRTRVFHARKKLREILRARGIA